MNLLRKCIQSIKDVWMIIGIALGLLIVAEVGLSLGFYLKDTWSPPVPNFRRDADTYSDRAWAIRYYQEIEEIEKGRSMRWHPYVYWRRLPRHGELINITEEGLRKTHNITKGTVPATKVFMFGGSTLWGLGAGDNETIPSLFAKEAGDKGINCEVVNYGQYAYVSGQGVVELMRQLQRGNIPDVVVFYDGTNDTFGAFQLGVAGLPHDEFYREKEFGLLRRPELYTAAVQSAIRHLAIMRLLDGALKRVGLRNNEFQPISMEYEKPMADKKALARAVAEAYLNNVRLVQALSKSYGFKCVFYWQPVLFTKQHLTEYERKSLDLDVSYPGMKEFYLDTYRNIQQCSANLEKEITFYDISSIFQDVQEPIYTDFNHMGDKGNRVIAKRMIQDMEQFLIKTEKSKPDPKDLAKE